MGSMKQLTLRLPDDVHARLKARAEREHRSMHAELLHLIDQALSNEAPPTTSGAHRPDPSP